MEEKKVPKVYFCFLLALHSTTVLKLDTNVSSETSAPGYQNIRRYMQDFNFQFDVHRSVLRNIFL